MTKYYLYTYTKGSFRTLYSFLDDLEDMYTDVVLAEDAYRRAKTLFTDQIIMIEDTGLERKIIRVSGI